jgi:O-antigen ligase
VHVSAQDVTSALSSNVRPLKVGRHQPLRHPDLSGTPEAKDSYVGFGVAMPIAVLALLVVHPLLWERHLVGKDRRFVLGVVSVPGLTAVFVVIALAEIVIALLAKQPTKGQLTTIGSMSFFGLALISGLLFGGNSRSLSEIFAWGLFAVHAAMTAHRLSSRCVPLWSTVALVFPVVGLISGRGLYLLPANINLGALVLVGALVVRASLCRNVIGILGLLPGVVQLILAGRDTATAALSAAILVWFFARVNRREHALQLVVFVIVLSIIVVAMQSPPKPATAPGTGIPVYSVYLSRNENYRRSILVYEALGSIREKPLFGVGYGQWLTTLERAGVHHEFVAMPHNLYLDTLVELGVVGFIALLLFFRRLWRRALSAESCWPMVLLSAIFVYLSGGAYVNSPGFWCFIPVALSMGPTIQQSSVGTRTPAR